MTDGRIEATLLSCCPSGWTTKETKTSQIDMKSNVSCGTVTWSDLINVLYSLIFLLMRSWLVKAAF